MINTYISFLQDNQNVNFNENGIYDFSFALNRTLKESRAVFQNSLLDIMLRGTWTIKNTCSNLGISESTYVKARSRNRNYRDSRIPEPVIAFIRHHEFLNWKDINSMFDDYILTYLYHQYGLNKKRLSDKLGINYSQLVTRFKQINTDTAETVTSLLKYQLS